MKLSETEKKLNRNMDTIKLIQNWELDFPALRIYIEIILCKSKGKNIFTPEELGEKCNYTTNLVRRCISKLRGKELIEIDRIPQNLKSKFYVYKTKDFTFF